jgi:hypothetical protein
VLERVKTGGERGEMGIEGKGEASETYEHEHWSSRWAENKILDYGMR